MKKIVTALFLFCSYGLHAQTGDSAVLRSLSDEIMLHGTCYDNLRELTLNIGHRLSGSPAAAKAVLWAEAALKEAGADTVWLQPALVPHWVRGEESLFIQMDKEEKYEPVAMLSLGNTEGTGGKLLEKEIIYVPDFKTFDALSESAVKGRVVFFDYHFRQDIINTFKGYRDAVVYRWEAASKAAAKQAAAVIIRSTSTAPDDVPHAGSAHYEKGVKHIPAVAIGNLSADRLAKACKKGHPKARLISNCRFEQPVKSYNVIGGLKGSEKPDEYMVVAGHLDSWDVGEGAQDDGAGIVQSIEVLRTLKKMNMRPRHTLRVVCYERRKWHKRCTGVCRFCLKA